MKLTTWNEIQEMLDVEEVQTLVENIVDSPNEDNVLCFARFIIETYIESQK
ncbi:hypothetical protein BI049_gp081 [Salmonella phage vB_SnwM_CGG4-1]|uniref:Uncharacterized protein n=1 Tax=Salmonella phage vB_SnwM_CGG4-1 TaxID=1815631 RepID=A0A1B0VVF2_9CAUD|nr:hypothetical protein BI049_gp081 [Salmonella phage vB_SnwM_CGG4-1]ANA49435.1 hypothetical protein CGG41_081 [Salmonella phage vB_SnwM_CGG4-1]